LNLAKVTVVKNLVKICHYRLCSGVAAAYADDGHRPKHVAAF